MFNLNIPPSSLLGFEGSGLCSTPKTPEIVNSLIAMTNPMDSYSYSTAAYDAASMPGNAVLLRHFGGAQNHSSQAVSRDSSCAASPLDSPAGVKTTPSVQQTCSQLIKAGLKLSIQSKRKLSTCDSSSGSEQPNSKCSRRDEDCDDSTDDDSENKLTAKGLTPEDEDRRRRRRERNKIAATKCRMKKRERTQNLIKESEQLDMQNLDLKSQVRVLETERQKLFDMLQTHSATCLRRGGFCLPSKLLHSPALKYLVELELDSELTTAVPDVIIDPSNKLQLNKSQTQTTAIPPMSTIKFSRSNGFKAAVAATDMAHTVCQQQIHQLPAQSSSIHHHQLPNGYCKASPTAQELGYLNSPSQDSICMTALQPHLTTPTATAAAAVNHHLTEYIPNCESSIGLGIGHTHTPTTNTSSNGDSSALLSQSASSPLTMGSTPTTATEFVKNELVDSQSPYTTAQSAERFLFESNCDNYVDIKHAVSVHTSNIHNNSSSNTNHSNASNHTANSNNNNNLLDFHSSLIGVAGGIAPFHDQISIKNDYLHEADLLAQLTAGDAGEFVDLDTGVAAAFMANGGCLA